MIYSLKHQYCFVHIPRTGGISITMALAEADREAPVLDRDARHTPAREACTMLGPAAWPRMYRFAVMRNPWAVCESDYRLTLSSAARLGDDPAWGTGWLARTQRADAAPDFRRFVEEEWLGAHSGIEQGGLWHTWCCDADGVGLGVEAVEFGRLRSEWDTIVGRCGLTPVALPRLNAGQERAVKWAPDLVDRVGALCDGDVARFGYRFEGELE